MDMKGKLRYKVADKEYTFGILTSYGETYVKSGNTVPLVSLSYKDAFAVETSSALNCSMSFVRIQPDSPNDSSPDSIMWSNEHWYEEITSLIDRWQTLTDGGVLSYVPDYDNPYVPQFKYNGYIKSLSRSYLEGRNTEIMCNMEFHVGTMYVSNPMGINADASIQPKDRDKFQILMSDANETIWYPLLSRVKNSETGEIQEINCVTSYRIYGGAEEPFEHATLTIPRDRLVSIAPELDNPLNMVAGKNKIILDAVGKASMYLVSSSLSGNEYKIDAYCDATVLKEKTLEIDYSSTPFEWIERILGNGKYGVSFRAGSIKDNVRGTFIYSCFMKDDDLHDTISFQKGTNIWLILQICAIYLGCKIFFANGNAYLIDYRLHKDEINRKKSENPSPVDNDVESVIYLYSDNPDDPIYTRTVGGIELGREGLHTLVNSQQIKCNGYDDDTGRFTNSKPYTGTKQDSINEFGTKEGDVMYIPGILHGKDASGVMHDQAKTFVDAYLDYRAEPQQSIEFTLREMQNNNKGSGRMIEWAPFFEPTAAVGSIVSPVSNTTVSNVTVVGNKKNVDPAPQKLILSQYERRYPEGTTTYWFGQMSSVDLSSSTSQIVGNINNL